MRPAQGERLFVYGTLLSTAEHRLGRLLREKARLIGAASIQARLYIIEEIDDQGVNRYPGALPTAAPGHRVWGEVYDLRDPAPLLAELDRFEACSPDWPEPHEFLLRRIPVEMASGEALDAWSYLYSWDVSAATPVPSGRFDLALPEAR